MKIKIFFSLLLTLLLVSCRGKEFTIEFNLSQDVDANYRILYYASDKKGGRWMESTAPIHQGKFIAECQTINPTIVYIFFSNGRTPETFFYAERGDNIIITGKTPNPTKWTFKGNDITEHLSEWQAANQNALSGNSPAEINKAIASYVEKNPKSDIDPLLLLVKYNRELDPEGFVKLWNGMNKKLRTDSRINLIAIPDILTLSTLNFDDKGIVTLLPDKKNFSQILTRKSSMDFDTLRLTEKGRKASLVWFWHIGDPERAVIVDSLRAFSRLHQGDSLKLLLADICLEGDSLRWKNTLRADSLTNFKRGWWPEGSANNEALRLGIGAYRTFIIFGPKGEIVYNGGELKKALTELRKKLK